MKNLQKKFLVIVLIFTLCFSLGNTVMAEEDFMFGDVNGDGAVNVQDVVLMIRHILELTHLSEEQKKSADIRGNGVIDIRDVTLVTQYALGMIKTFELEFEPKPEPEAEPPQPKPESPAFSIVKDRANSIVFIRQATMRNTSSEVAKDVVVALPLLEGKPYWSNYPKINLNQGIATFNVGEIQPQEEKILTVRYNLTLRTSYIEGSSARLRQAQNIFNTFSSLGNCMEVHTNFRNKLAEEGFEARMVYGFTQPYIRDLQSGDVLRHSWLEIYFEEAGIWLPADINYQYFGGFPYTSHITMGNRNLSARYVQATDGHVEVDWRDYVIR